VGDEIAGQLEILDDLPEGLRFRVDVDDRDAFLALARRSASSGLSGTWDFVS
jgi:hypothetical protein